MTSRNSPIRLPPRSVDCSDRPVTLPPGCARLATNPPPTGSLARANTMGMADVARLTVETEGPSVRMTSTGSRTNSAAISASRSGPFDQRYSNATVRPSLQPSAFDRSIKAAIHGAKVAASAKSKPTVGSLVPGCPRAARGQAIAPPRRVKNARRCMKNLLMLEIAQMERETDIAREGSKPEEGRDQLHD